MPVAHDPRQNRLLAALPDDVYRRLLPDLEPVALPLGAALLESGAALTHVYFPTTGVVSMLQPMADAPGTEIAVVGNDAMVGWGLVMGDETTFHPAVVQSAGEGLRIRSQPLRIECDRAGAMLEALLRHAQALIAQMVQTAACRRHHSVEQQFCRWLLLSLDRLPANALVATHAVAADMLGIGLHETDTLARRLQVEGLIGNSGGGIEVRNRARVEAHACECYALVRKEVDRLLLDPLPGRS